MRKMAGLSLALLMAVPLAGCGTTRDDRAVNGALLGGATGAVVGGLATGRAGGALAGGAIGAAAGAIIGAETAPQRRCVRWAMITMAIVFACVMFASTKVCATFFDHV